MAEVLEERQAKVEATLQQMDKRLGNVEVALRDLNAKVDDLNKALNARIDNLTVSLNARIDALSDKIDTKTDTLSAKIDANFRWTIAMWITTILAFVTTMLTILLKD